MHTDVQLRLSHNTDWVFGARLTEITSDKGDDAIKNGL